MVKRVVPLPEAATFAEAAITPYSALGPHQLASMLPAFSTQTQLLAACPGWLTILAYASSLPCCILLQLNFNNLNTVQHCPTATEVNANISTTLAVQDYVVENMDRHTYSHDTEWMFHHSPEAGQIFHHHVFK